MPIYKKKDKHGKIIKNEKGIELWYFRDYYTDIYGKRKQYKSGAFAGKKEVQEAERDWLKNLDKQNQTSSSISFTDAFNEWQLFKKKQLKVSTYYGFEARTNKYIKQFFQNYLKLHSIKMDSIDKWYTKIEKEDLSLVYKNTLIGYLKDFLNYCRDNFDFNGKVLSKIQKFRIDTPKEKLTDAQTNFWSYEEWKKFINSVEDYNDWVMYKFLYSTGLRFGEFCALKVSDYNPNNKTISITKSLTNKVKGVKYAITTPKTTNSVRIIDLDDETVKILNEYIEYKKNNYYGFNEDFFLFGDVRYVAQTTFKRHLDKNISRLGDNFKRITPHGFRHSHVSLLIYLECDSRDVAERIGDTVETVEKTYYHIFPQKKKIVIDKLNNIEK